MANLQPLAPIQRLVPGEQITLSAPCDGVLVWIPLDTLFPGYKNFLSSLLGLKDDIK